MHFARRACACWSSWAAAGITSAYNAPIAGAFFVSEIVLGGIAMESLADDRLVGRREHRDARIRRLPPYEMPVFPAVTGPEVLLFVVLGALCGVLAPQFLHLLDASKNQFKRLPVLLRGSRSAASSSA